MDFKQTAMALVRLVAPVIAGAATMLGVTIDADIIVNILLCVATVMLFFWSWWKNNNITKAAQEAQELLDNIKKEATDD